jgi:hypothetical protein
MIHKKSQLPVINLVHDGTVISDLTDATNEEQQSIRKGGWIKGSKNIDKEKQEQKYKEALTEASVKCYNSRTEAVENNKKLPKGSFLQIAKETEQKFGLNENS